MKDAYGGDFDKDITSEYDGAFDTFEESVEIIRLSGKSKSYNRGIMKNSIFELAQKIIENSYACRLFFYRKI